MAKQLFSNNATSLLAVTINNVATTVQVGAGHGALFPSPTGGDWFLITLVDAQGNREICKCTSRSTDVLTVTRAQEGTTALTWTGNVTRVEHRLTADSLEAFVQRSGDTFTDLLAAGNLDMNGNTIVDAVLTGASLTSPTLTTPAITANATITGTSPYLILNESDGGADEKVWKLDSIAEVLRLRTRTDADGAGSTIVEVSRSGTAVTDISFGNGADDPTYTFLGSGGMTVGGSAVLTAATTTVASGTYSPTLATGLNMGAVTLQGLAQYLRVGSIVHVSMRVNADPTAAGVCGFTATLPVASNFGAATDAHGVVVGSSTGAGEVGADTSTDTLSAFWNAASGSSDNVRLVATYLII